MNSQHPGNPMRWLYFFMMAFLTFGCTPNDQAEPPYPNQYGNIEVWDQNPDFYAWGGKDPVLLLGADGQNWDFNQDDLELRLGRLVAAGGNLVKFPIHLRNPRVPGQDSTKVDSEHRVRSLKWFYGHSSIRKALDATDRRGVVLDLEITHGAEHPLDTVTQRKLKVVIDTLRAAIGPHRNVILTSDLPEIKVLANELDIPSAEPVRRGDVRQKTWAARGWGPEHTYKLALLEGRGGVHFNTHPLRPSQQPTAPTGLALTTIRSVRSAEQLIEFWKLKPDSSLLVARPGGAPARAARTDAGDVLVYMGGAGSVTLRIPSDGTVPYDVTVIGYLGTKRSERLEPPYDTTFTLRSNEERGGWLLLKTVDD